MKAYLILCVCGLLLALSGCQYYEVKDPGSGKTYITDNWHIQHQWLSGGVTFTDIQSGERITLQNTEIKAVSSDQGKVDSVGGGLTQ